MVKKAAIAAFLFGEVFIAQHFRVLVVVCFTKVQVFGQRGS
jgi:hypothetical protein